MNAVSQRLRPIRAKPAAQPGSLLVTASLALALGIGMAFALYRSPPSWSLVIAACLGIAGLLALAVARYEAAVALAFLLFGVARSEPAPPDIVLGIVIAVALVTGRFRIERVPLSMLAVVGVFLVLNLLSMVEAIDLEVAGRFVAISLYLSVFSLWFTAYLDSRRRARMVLVAYLVAAVASALAASLALVVGLPGADVLLMYSGTRASGLFDDPNIFGPFLVPAALILLDEWLDPKLLRLGGLWKGLLFSVLVVGVLFSYSRAAWMNLAVGVLVFLGVMLLRRGGAGRAAAVIAAIVTTALVTAALVALTGSSELLGERTSLQEYDVDRFAAQRTGIELGERYVFGIGPGQFDVRAPVSTHSVYLRALAEQGLLGLVTVVALLVGTLVLAARNVLAGRDTYGIGSAALLGAWVGILANSFFIDSLHWRHLWLVAALVWAGAMRPLGGLDRAARRIRQREALPAGPVP